MRTALLRTSLAACCVAVAAPTSGVTTHGLSDVTVLTAGLPVERDLAPGDAHRYQLALGEGELAQVVVEQQGIDVDVRVRDGNGDAIEAVHEERRRDGEEQVDLVTGWPGTYSLTIEPAEGAVESGKYTVRLAGRRPATDADRILQESRSLRSEAEVLEKAGTFDRARQMFERALSLAETVRGPQDAYVAAVVFDMAGNALETHDDARARSLYQRAIAAFDGRWGAGHPCSAMARSRLGLVYQRAGQPRRAEALVRQALSALERSLGPDHPWFVQTLVTLGNLRDDAGDLEQAEAIDRRALEAVDRIHETGTILDATLLNNLALLRRKRKDAAGAEAFLKRALAIGQSLQGPDSYFVSTELQNLGIVARERKDYAAALADYTRALAIRERIVGLDHPAIASLLNNMANVYRATGDAARALDTHFRALHIWEKAQGAYGRSTLVSVGNIARTYAAVGDIPKAVAFERRADAILERQLALNLAAGSERQKLAFVRSVSERTDRTLSLNLDQAPGDPDASSLAALVLLQRKGRVQDAMTDVFATLRQHVASPEDRALMDGLNDITARLARLALNRPDAESPDDGEDSFADLDARKERLESLLSEHSAEFRSEMQPVTLEAVQAAIPEEAALLEFAVFRPFDPKAEANADAYGPAHYAVYVVRTQGAPIGVDLGAAAPIDVLIRTFRNALRDPADADVTVRARAVDERVMQPLRASLAGVTRLLISPDGDLNLVPFEALADEHGRYLIERYATSYLTSGRDLLRMQAPRAAPGRAIIVADPVFGEPRTAGVGQQARAGVPSPGMPRTVTPGTEMSRLYFAPLSGSAAEARAIKALFPEATLLTGRRATKARVEQVKAPRILHIASHGFFLRDEGANPAASRNPLLRSGLALAGANLAPGAGGDGILTALEAAGLDLWGTRLVTLSACDTGVGEVRSGEGVYGLRRAFVLAGAESVVMSLWPVSDSIARATMVAYYTRLRAGAGRGDALRDAKRSILQHPDRRHPYYWAGFIQSGDWTGLDHSDPRLARIRQAPQR